MARQHNKQFKLNTIQSYEEHKALCVREYAENLSIGYSTLIKWLKDFRKFEDAPFMVLIITLLTRRKNARLRRKLRDVQNVLDSSKKQSTFWKNSRSHLPRSV